MSTGIAGQDGLYFAELLLGRGYEVHDIIRRASTLNTERIDHICHDPHESDVRLQLHYGDWTDGSQIARVIRTVQPDEIYNLAVQSQVAVSFQQPEYTDVDGLGVQQDEPRVTTSSAPARPHRPRVRSDRLCSRRPRL